jgi:hypothetical protein
MNCCTHLARLARNESYENWYVPKNCQVTVEQEDERDPSRPEGTVRVRPEILDFAGKGERIVVIENRYRFIESKSLEGATRLPPTHQQGTS